MDLEVTVGRDVGEDARTRRAAGELESDVLGTLWAAAAPLTPAQVHAALDGDLAYNTVHTILTRLYDKGLVRRVSRSGRRGYAPVRDAAALAADRMRDVLDRGGDRAQILHRFVTSLSSADEQALREALAREDPR